MTSRRHLARRAADALLVVVGVSAMMWMDRDHPNLTATQAPFPTPVLASGGGAP